MVGAEVMRHLPTISVLNNSTSELPLSDNM